MEDRSTPRSRDDRYRSDDRRRDDARDEHRTRDAERYPDSRISGRGQDSRGSRGHDNRQDSRNDGRNDRMSSRGNDRGYERHGRGSDRGSYQSSSRHGDRSYDRRSNDRRPDRRSNDRRYDSRSRNDDIIAPPVRKRELDSSSSFDLIVPPTRRQKTSSAWDAPPSAQQLSGQSSMNADRGGAVGGGFTAGFGTGFGNNAGKHSVKIYCGNLPETSEYELTAFLNKAMKTALITDPDPSTPCVVSLYLRMEKRFAFVEYRSPEEATASLHLDGLEFKGFDLRFRRPSDYTPSAGSNAESKLDTTRLGLAATQMASVHKIFVGGLPVQLREEQVKQFVGAFGELKVFLLVRERDSDTSKGYCFCEYVDESITDEACMGLSGLYIWDKMITARRAVPLGGDDIGNSDYSHQLNAIPAPEINLEPQTASTVVCLMQMVTPDELLDEDEYEEIKEDIFLECQRYGEVISVEIPKPDSDGAVVPGIGKVFVEFSDVEQATGALESLHGRRFSSRTIIASYYDADKFQAQEFE